VKIVGVLNKKSNFSDKMAKKIVDNLGKKRFLSMDVWKIDMNVIRETVRVVKEEMEKNPGVYNKYYKPEGEGHGIGQTGISNFLGGPWLREYQIKLISEAIDKVRESDGDGGLAFQMEKKVPGGKGDPPFSLWLAGCVSLFKPNIRTFIVGD
jgi:hypothetical protein